MAAADLKQAAKQVAVDANQVREDLKTLLLSRENLSVETAGADCREDRRGKAVIDRRSHRLAP
jgi:phage host-nuclease inhibitor protein Gam